jgi:hypothetical protein
MLGAVSAATFFWTQLALLQFKNVGRRFGCHISKLSLLDCSSKMMDAVSAASFLSSVCHYMPTATKSIYRVHARAVFPATGVMMPALHAHSLPRPRVIVRSEAARCARLDADDLT